MSVHYWKCFGSRRSGIQLVFADSVVPSDGSAPCAGLKLAAASRVIVSKSEDLGRHFGIENLVDGVYVVGNTLEECPEYDITQDVVRKWLEEREEARSYEQGMKMGIVWACGPPRVQVSLLERTV